MVRVALHGARGAEIGSDGLAQWRETQWVVSDKETSRWMAPFSPKEPRPFLERKLRKLRYAGRKRRGKVELRPLIDARYVPRLDGPRRWMFAGRDVVPVPRAYNNSSGSVVDT